MKSIVQDLSLKVNTQLVKKLPFFYYVSMSLLSDPILSQFHPVLTFTPYFSKIHFSIHHLTTVSLK